MIRIRNIYRKSFCLVVSASLVVFKIHELRPFSLYSVLNKFFLQIKTVPFCQWDRAVKQDRSVDKDRSVKPDGYSLTQQGPSWKRENAPRISLRDVILVLLEKGFLISSTLTLPKYFSSRINHHSSRLSIKI